MPQRYRYTGETHAIASFPWTVNGQPVEPDQPLEPGQEFESDHPINNAVFLKLDEKGKVLGPAVLEPDPEPEEPAAPAEPEVPQPLDAAATPEA